jgi:hypothetical protein
MRRFMVDYFDWREDELERLRLELFKISMEHHLERVMSCHNELWDATWVSLDKLLSGGKHDDNQKSLDDYKRHVAD